MKHRGFQAIGMTLVLSSSFVRLHPPELVKVGGEPFVS